MENLPCIEYFLNTLPPLQKKKNEINQLFYKFPSIHLELRRSLFNILFNPPEKSGRKNVILPIKNDLM